MCRKYPGKRCVTEVRKALDKADKAKRAFEEEHPEYTATFKAYYNAPLGPERGRLLSKLGEFDPSVRKEYQRLRHEFAQEQDAYYSTAEGLKEFKAMVEKLSEDADPNDPQVAHCQRRLEHYQRNYAADETLWKTYKDEIEPKLQESLDEMRRAQADPGPEHSVDMALAGVLVERGCALPAIHPDYLLFVEDVDRRRELMTLADPDARHEMGFNPLYYYNEEDRYRDTYYGVTNDDEVRNHVRKCGILDVDDVHQSGLAQFVDTMDEDNDPVDAVSADITCHCGRVYKHQFVITDITLRELIRKVVEQPKVKPKNIKVG